MPTKGKLLSDYKSEEWKRYRQRLLKPDLVYWITIISLAFLLLLSGFGRIPAEGYTLNVILRIAGGGLLTILLTAYLIQKTSRRTHK
jgi:hypothetical protein